MGMTGNAVFIFPDEHGIVIFFAIFGRLRTLIDQLFFDEGIQHLRRVTASG